MSIFPCLTDYRQTGAYDVILLDATSNTLMLSWEIDGTLQESLVWIMVQYRSQNDEWQNGTVLETNANSYIVEGLSPGELYELRVLVLIDITISASRRKRAIESGLGESFTVTYATCPDNFQGQNCEQDLTVTVMLPTTRESELTAVPPTDELETVIVIVIVCAVLVLIFILLVIIAIFVYKTHIRRHNLIKKHNPDRHYMYRSRSGSLSFSSTDSESTSSNEVILHFDNDGTNHQYDIPMETFYDNVSSKEKMPPRMKHAIYDNPHVERYNVAYQDN
ncbi:uncharacterized protein LOC117099990 [Anneissia japonica]|uniref:uncharacterized protein LOC117099990 n=1 Tax=Anneissia japonica TaxID=1529436 RepID=UPI0014258103|nr:uncharacterized protein LOC117099990 [Anneissia japonica]